MLRGVMICLPISAIVALAACGPKTQEDCRTHAAESAKNAAALAILLEKCSAEFPGKRNIDGTFTYIDPETKLSVKVSGSTLSAEDLANIKAAHESWGKAQWEDVTQQEIARAKAEEEASQTAQEAAKTARAAAQDAVDAARRAAEKM